MGDHASFFIKLHQQSHKEKSSVEQAGRRIFTPIETPKEKYSLEKCPEITFVIIWRHINKIELNQQTTIQCSNITLD